MTRSTHLESPEPADVRALLAEAGWSAYRAAQLIGITARAMQQACSGETRLRGALWQLLQIHARQSARDALPPAPLP